MVLGGLCLLSCRSTIFNSYFGAAFDCNKGNGRENPSAFFYFVFIRLLISRVILRGTLACWESFVFFAARFMVKCPRT